MNKKEGVKVKKMVQLTIYDFISNKEAENFMIKTGNCSLSQMINEYPSIIVETDPDISIKIDKEKIFSCNREVEKEICEQVDRLINKYDGKKEENLSEKIYFEVYDLIRGYVNSGLLKKHRI